MLAAAAAWDGVAVDLGATAASFDEVITGLVSGPWLGAAATTMAAAAAPYVAWLNTTAAQAEEAAVQAKAAVAAYETAYAMTVHPALVAANRAQLATLVATNFLGQNSAAIALTEMQYGEMWAQDSTAMYCYVAASASAMRLTPLSAPPQTVAGPLGTTAVVSQTSVSSAASTVASLMSDLALLGQGDTALPGWITDLDTLMSIFGTPFFVCTSSTGLMMSMMSTIKGLFPAAAAVGSQIATAAGTAAAEAAHVGSAGLAGAVAADLGEAESIGGLSVPPSWAASAPTLSHAAVAALPGAVSSAAAPSAAAPGLLGGLPLPGTEGRTGGDGNATQDGIAPLRVLPSLIG